MQLTLRIPWRLIDATTQEPRIHMAIAGQYEVERIPNPFGYTEHPWIVLKNTRIGGPEAFWRDWLDEHNGDFTVQLEEKKTPQVMLGRTVEPNH